MIIASKEIDRYSNIKDDKEYIHITEEEFEVKDIVESDITDFHDNILSDNDLEENYFSYGISTDWEGNIMDIDVEMFIEGLTSWFESEKEHQEDSRYYLDLVNKLKTSLTKYEGYTLKFRHREVIKK